MARLRDEGVNFRNSHSVFPTFTTANASAFSTGHLSDGRLQQYHFPRLCGPSGERRRNAIPGVSMDNFLGAGKSNFTVFLKGTDQKGGPQGIDALVVSLRTTTLAPGSPLTHQILPSAFPVLENLIEVELERNGDTP
jgi:hypothetical protein